MTKSILAFAVALGCMPCAALAACDEVAEGSASYELAAARVRALPEFKAWIKYVSGHPRVKAVTFPAVDRQQLIRGHCYWSVSAYSDEDTHLHRWNTFYISLDGKRILVGDMSGGDPLPLNKWRSSSSGREWRSKSQTPPSAAAGR